MVRTWATRQVEREREAPPRSWADRCPVCGEHDHIERVSTVVHRNSGAVMIGGTSYPYVSNLAKMLALPDAPKTPDGEALLRRVFWSWLAATVGLAVLFILREESPVDLPENILKIAMIGTGLVLGILIPVAALATFLWQQHVERVRMPVWLGARERW